MSLEKLRSELTTVTHYVNQRMQILYKKEQGTPKSEEVMEIHAEELKDLDLMLAVAGAMKGYGHRVTTVQRIRSYARSNGMISEVDISKINFGFRPFIYFVDYHAVVHIGKSSSRVVYEIDFEKLDKLIKKVDDKKMKKESEEARDKYPQEVQELIFES